MKEEGRKKKKRHLINKTNCTKALKIGGSARAHIECSASGAHVELPLLGCTELPVPQTWTIPHTLDIQVFRGQQGTPETARKERNRATPNPRRLEEIAQFRTEHKTREWIKSHI